MGPSEALEAWMISSRIVKGEIRIAPCNLGSRIADSLVANACDGFVG